MLYYKCFVLAQWTDRELPEVLNYTQQPEWQRKEKVYLEIIDYFDRGKVRCFKGVLTFVPQRLL